MFKSLGAILMELRKERGYTQNKVAELLALEGFSIQTAGVSKWEKGQTQPSAAQFLALCSIYEVRDVMGTFTDKPTPMNRLNPEGRKLVADYTRVLIASGLYEAEKLKGELRLLPVYDLPASAGVGEFLDTGDYTETEVPSIVPGTADFGVRIVGDSMAPGIADGGIVWVSKRETIDEGRVGIFYLNGKGYCKRLRRDRGYTLLLSDNTAYAPIEVGEGDDLSVFGEVVATT